MISPAISGARAALKEVEAELVSLDIFSTSYEGASQIPSVGARRRRLRAGQSDPVATVSLVVNDAEVLLWREDASGSRQAGYRGGIGAAPPPDGELVEMYQFEKLEPNSINRFLTDLDAKLNTDSGLYRLRPNAAPEQLKQKPSGKKRRLLFVHGTFSKSAAFFEGFAKAPNGKRFLERIHAHYDEVLAFEHPTLSVSPMINAYDLALQMRDAAGPLDVIAHSRGGLVARWFLEGFGAASTPCRAALVGCPLGGTSLASPPRLRDALSALSNLGTALKAGGSAAAIYFPLLAAPLALMKVATSVISVAAQTPVVDAAVAMIPGLSGQSRVLLNHELDRVRRFGPPAPPRYFVVRSNFEAERAGWKFWKWFRADQLKDMATDRIFPGTNDLVVDTASMSEFTSPAAAMAAADVQDFGTSSIVHHTNYFEQKETLDFIADRFAIP